MTPANHRGDGETPPKGTLFCHECDHRSRYDGDWALAETDGGTAYLCPECGETITVRPARVSSLRSSRSLIRRIHPFVRPTLDGDDGNGRIGDLWRVWGACGRASVLVPRLTANACLHAASAPLGNAKW